MKEERDVKIYIERDKNKNIIYFIKNLKTVKV